MMILFHVRINLMLGGSIRDVRPLSDLSISMEYQHRRRVKNGGCWRVWRAVVVFI